MNKYINRFQNKQDKEFDSKVFDLGHYDFKETAEPFGFVGQLKPYQRLALTWMLCREDVINQRGR